MNNPGTMEKTYYWGCAAVFLWLKSLGSGDVERGTRRSRRLGGGGLLVKRGVSHQFIALMFSVHARGLGLSFCGFGCATTAPGE